MSGTVGIAAVFLFLASNLLVGLFGHRIPGDAESFVLGGRNLSPFMLLATMAATNFSAFTVFGLSGAGYRLGWSYLPVMAFGTGFVAFAFLLVGMPVRRLARERGWMTQSDLIRDRYGSPGFAKAVSAALLACTLPYIAAQIIAGGRLIAAATGVPYEVACAAVASVTLGYILAGGMRSVVRTDVLQLAILVGGSAAAFVAVSANGGLAAAAERLSVLSPGHLSRSGAGTGVSFGTYAGYVLLWFLADPMFPQLFQRFIGARSDRSIAFTAICYPIVTTGLFFCTVGIGVAGAATFPGIDRASSEGIFMRMSAQAAGGGMAAVFGLAALAALMSTLDSQILSVSSMLVKDWLPGREGSAKPVRFAAVAVVAVAWLVSLRPPATILDLLTSTSFPGYAAIGVVFLAALFAKRTGITPAVAAFATGMLLVVLEASGLLLVPGPLPVFFNTTAQAAAFGLAAVPRLFRAKGAWRQDGSFPSPAIPPAAFVIILVSLAAGLDFWAYGKVVTVIEGLPAWLWLHLALGAGLPFAVAACARVLSGVERG